MSYLKAFRGEIPEGLFVFVTIGVADREEECVRLEPL